MRFRLRSSLFSLSDILARFRFFYPPTLKASKSLPKTLEANFLHTLALWLNIRYKFFSPKNDRSFFVAGTVRVATFF